MSEETIEDCLICLEPMKQRVLLPCGHSPACLRCFVTYNQCYGKRICPFCQREITAGDPIIIDSPVTMNYADELKKNYQHDDEFHFYYKNPKAIKELKSFQIYKCKNCGYVGKNYGALHQHLKRSHQQFICKICHNANRFLPSEIPSYSHNEFQKHMKQHPTCPVCPFIAFDHSQLTEHMRDNHFRCDICADQGNILWFATLDLIQVHFHTCHFACEDPMCVQQGFIVFATEFELQMHRSTVHGDKSPIILDFNQPPPAPKPDYKNEHKQRVIQANKKLRKALQAALNKNEEKIQQIFQLITQVQNKQVSVHNFLQQISDICEDASDGLFCNIVAAIGNPHIRACVVKAHQGIRPCKLPISQPVPQANNAFPAIAHIEQTTPAENPSKDSTSSSNQQPRKTGGKKKQKRTILVEF